MFGGLGLFGRDEPVGFQGETGGGEPGGGRVGDEGAELVPAGDAVRGHAAELGRVEAEIRMGGVAEDGLLERRLNAPYARAVQDAQLITQAVAAGRSRSPARPREIA